MNLRRWAALLAAGVFLVCLAVYLPTLNPAFRADDSPETMATAYTLGIQHPPGYPLQSLLGRVASQLPLGAVAWRLNLLAALLGALACALLSLSALALARDHSQELGLEPAAALAGGLLAGASAGVLLGCSSTFWSQSLAAKGGIYTLHMALMAGTLLALLQWSRQALRLPTATVTALLNLPAARLGGLLLFLGLSNHWETQALVFPSAGLLLLAGLWRRPWGRGLGRALAWLGLLAVAGLAVYAYLPLRASQGPFLNWGDPRNWDQFWWVLLRQEYLDLETGFLKSLRAALLAGGPWSQVAANWQFVQRQGLRVLGHIAGPQADLGLPAVLLSLVGAYGLRPRGLSWPGGLRARMGLALAALVLVFLGVVTFYFQLQPELIWILDVFLLPVYLVQALLAGLGAACLLRRLGRARWTGIAAVGALTLLPWGLFALRAPALTQDRQFLAWDFAQDLLLSVKRGGILLAEGDFNTMPVYYLQQVAGQRRDVDHVTTVFLSTDWGVENARRNQPRLGLGALPKASTGQRAGDGHVLRAAIANIAQANLPARPLQASLFRQVLSANVPEWEPSPDRRSGGVWRPMGLTVELEPQGTPSSPADERRRLGLLKAFRTRHLELDRANLDPSPAFALSNYGTVFLETALYLRQQHRSAEAMPLYAKAVGWTSRANLAEAWTHWGIALASGGDGLKPDLDGAVRCFEQALAVKPLFEAYINLSGVQNQRGQATHELRWFQASEALARKALALAPANPQASNNLAVALYYQNRKDEALQALRIGLQANPQDPQMRNNLAAMGGR